MPEDDDTPRDNEANRLSGRLSRYARVGTGVGTAAARVAAGRAFSSGGNDMTAEARLFRQALGTLKGPLMKVAQLLATIPEALPAEFAEELAQLQNEAPAMGWPFVRRRMAAELGPDWQQKFGSFEREAAAAASMGQVHRATSLDGEPLACKLQCPDMASAVEADLSQLKVLFALHRQMSRAIDTTEIAGEIGARLREELDYVREAGHMRLYKAILAERPTIRIPELKEELCTRRLITMQWLEGRKLLEFKQADEDIRNLLCRHMFDAWWRPFTSHGVIHGDPHLGNYTAWEEADGTVKGLNLLDYGCIRVFPPSFVRGVIELYRGLQREDRDQIVHAYEIWGFKGLNDELIDILNVWARFIYGPLLTDKVMAISDGSSSAAQYGRQQAFTVHKELKEKGPVRVPKEFVFMDRAAIGLGSVFIHLRARMNFHQLFEDALQSWELDTVGERQAQALDAAGVAPQIEAA
jgi:predicted unusual protein kinase regulating ubiquinone biosynthesis (AarF/ABC1/UbiB family)